MLWNKRSGRRVGGAAIHTWHTQTTVGGVAFPFVLTAFLRCVAFPKPWSPVIVLPGRCTDQPPRLLHRCTAAGQQAQVSK